MSFAPEIRGEYPPDWDQIGDRVRAEAGNRCVRCGHPYETGKYGKGEWTPCDERCTHAGPLAIVRPELLATPQKISEMADFPFPDGCRLDDPSKTTLTVPAIERARPKGDTRLIIARWRILTVHHLDGNKANCEWWNLLPLCQRCHLQVQGKVNPEVPYFLEHSPWFRPYVAGFYAAKYENNPKITREQVESRLDELLTYERLA